jgi:adenylate cyclase
MPAAPGSRLHRAVRRASRAPLLRALGSGAAAALAALALRAVGGLVGSELWLHDRLVALREATRPQHVALREPEVALVTIDEDDLRAHGHPIPDATLARALRALVDGGASAVGVDLYRDAPVPPGTAELAALAAAEPRLVFVEKVEDALGEGVPPPAFAPPERVAASDVVVDSDGVVRRALLYLWDSAGRPHVGLGLRLVLVSLRDGPGARVLEPSGPDDDSREPLRLGAGRITRFREDDGGYRGGDDADYQILLDFRGDAPRRMSRYSLSALLAGAVPRARIEDRIVLVGSVARSVRDDFRAPSGELLLDTALRHGVEMHAQITEQLVRIASQGEPPVRFLPERAEAALVALAGLAVALAAMGVRSGRRLALATVLGIGLTVAAGAAAFWLGWWLPTAALGLAGALAAGATLATLRGLEHADRAALDRMLAVAVSRPVRDRLWAARDELLRDGRLRPRRMTATILMGDLEGYTAIAERLSPEEAIAWLDASLGPLAAEVEAAGGMVEDFAGDGVKACFGAPVRRRTEPEIDADARAAVRCALGACAAIERHNALLVARGLPPARLRLGLHSGEVVAGSLGDENRLKYATVGDTVNVAARLEELPEPALGEDPVAACRILISEETRARLGELASGLRLREVGERTLRGRTKPVRVWRLLPGLLLACGLAFGPGAARAGDEAPASPRSDAAPRSEQATPAGPVAASPPTPPRVAPPLDVLTRPLGPYVPPAPADRVPFRRVGGATRGGVACAAVVEALAPAEHAGETAVAGPALAFRLSAAPTCPVELVVNDPRRVEPILVLRRAGLGAGVHRVTLAEHGVSLAPGVIYDWSVRLAADDDAPSGDPVAGGAVRRAPEGAPLAARWYDLLDASSSAERDAILAAEGLAATTPSSVAVSPARP